MLRRLGSQLDIFRPFLVGDLPRLALDDHGLKGLLAQLRNLKRDLIPSGLQFKIVTAGALISPSPSALMPPWSSQSIDLRFQHLARFQKDRKVTAFTQPPDA